MLLCKKLLINVTMQKVTNKCYYVKINKKGVIIAQLGARQ